MIELDGDSHFSDAGERYDQRRTEALAVHGIRVIRFTNAEVLQNFEAVCVRVEEVLALHSRNQNQPPRSLRSRPPSQGVKARGG